MLKREGKGSKLKLVPTPGGHVEGTKSKWPLNWDLPVVGTGVDPVTSRISDRIFVILPQSRTPAVLGETLFNR
jgi:hypothetical protein